MNLWQMTQERQTEEAGQMWQRLEARVTGREQARLFAAVRALLERLSGRDPLVLFFENVQWADSTSWELLHCLAQRLQDRPILVLLVQRTGEEEDSSEAGLGEAIALGPLSLEGTAALVGHELGEALEPAGGAALAQAIHEQSGGNPLFIQEIVRWLRRSRPAGPVDLQAMLRASSTLRELVISRLDSLPYGQRAVAKAASVVGDEFQRSDPHPLLAERAEKALPASLNGLEQAQMTLMVEARTDPRYAFRQTLIRELVYDSQPFARRRELHGCIAAHLESRYADDLLAQAQKLRQRGEQS